MSALDYPHEIVRVRERPGGDYDNDGEWRPPSPPVFFTRLRASVQPVELDDQVAPGGLLGLERAKVYVPGNETVLRDDGKDKVIWNGETWTVEKSETWAGGIGLPCYTAAMLVREATGAN